MMLLFTVDQVFLVTGGVVLLPGLGQNCVRVGTYIRLVRPGKSTLDTKICGIGFNEFHDILLGPEVQKEDVPVGTEIWTIESL
jgi:hypothetical protein